MIKYKKKPNNWLSLERKKKQKYKGQLDMNGNILLNKKYGQFFKTKLEKMHNNFSFKNIIFNMTLAEGPMLWKSNF